LIRIEQNDNSALYTLTYRRSK